MIAVNVCYEYDTKFPKGLIELLKGHEVVQELAIGAFGAIHQDTITTNKS
jgi:hypothetical protein